MREFFNRQVDERLPLHMRHRNEVEGYVDASDFLGHGTCVFLNRLCVEGIDKAEGKTLEQFQAGLAKGAALGRLTKLTEVANVAAFMASDLASPMTATTANISCGSAVD